MAHVELRNVSKSFGAVVAIDDVSLQVEKGEFCALLGPSGCGKSTLLRMIAGLEAVSAGEVWINGANVTETAASKRSIAMVFQSYALYPHMKVRQNISFALEIAHEPKDRIAARVAAVAQMLQLEELLDRRPAQLSGGQRQRVAIGRALVRDPQVFLLDEPLSNLDALLRVQMRVELANLHRQLKATMIYVTHDQVEAMTLADRIVVLDRGRIAQVGTPLELYRQPANKFVASFIGSPSMNFMPVSPISEERGRITVCLQDGHRLPAPKRDPDAAAAPVELGVRPECMSIVEPEPDNPGGEVVLVEHLGNSTLVHVQTGFGAIVVQQSGDSVARLGEQVGLRFDPERVHLFDRDATVI